MRKIIATTGKVLTQSGETSLRNKIFVKEIYLAANDSPDNWTEISEEEATVLKVKQIELQKENSLS